MLLSPSDSTLLVLCDPGDPFSVRAAEDGMGSSSRGKATASGTTAASTMGVGTYEGASIPPSTGRGECHIPMGLGQTTQAWPLQLVSHWMG